MARHSLLNHTLTTHFFYIMLVMVMNLYLLESTFDYKSKHVKFTWQNEKNWWVIYWSKKIEFESRFTCAPYKRERSEYV
jgi:hypothetical protein